MERSFKIRRSGAELERSAPLHSAPLRSNPAPPLHGFWTLVHIVKKTGSRDVKSPQNLGWFEITSPHLTKIEVILKSPHLTSKLKNKQICYCFSTLEPQFLLKFSSKVTSPHLTSSKIEVISKSPHLTPKKIEVIFNHLTSPQRKWGDFKVTSPHLGKIEAISKSPHLTSKKSRWY